MPTRYLRPGIRDSERIESIQVCDAEILYYRLLVTVDDFGRFDARPDMIKAACFPIRKRATADKCMQWLQQLESSQLIRLYVVDGKSYLQVLKWENKARSQISKYPNPPTTADSPRALADNCMQMLPGTGTGTGTGTDTRANNCARVAGKPASVRVNGKSHKTPLPENFGQDWSPSMKAWLEGKEQVKAHLIHFVGYAKANGKTYVDWEQAFQNAVREDWAGIRKAGL